MDEKEWQDRNIFERFNPHSKDEDIFVNYPDVTLTKAERSMIAGLVTDYMTELTERSNLLFVDHIGTYQDLMGLAIGILKKISRDGCKMHPVLCEDDENGE
jgi:hypothetical protein